MFLQNGKEEKSRRGTGTVFRFGLYGSELGWRLQGSDLFDCLEPYFHSRLLGNIAPRDGRFIENILIGYIEGTPLLSKLCKRPNLQTKLQRLKDLQKK